MATNVLSDDVIVRMKVVYTFNQVLLNFIKDLRENSVLAKRVGKAHKIFDKESDTYLTQFAQHADALVAAIDKTEAFTFANIGDVGSLDILKNVSVAQIFEQLHSAEDQIAVNKYILTLLSICIVGADIVEDNATEVDNALGVLLQKLKDIETSGGELVDVSDVFDDDIRKILEVLSDKSFAAEDASMPVSEMTDGQDVNVEDFLEKVKNSKIGEIAKEVAKNINLDGISDPKDITKLASKLACSGNIGNMIQTVTNTIQSKISDGTMNTDELFGEAMNMMKHFNNGKGGLAGLFKNSQVNMAAMHNMDRNIKAKSRLREKLQKRAPSTAAV